MLSQRRSQQKTNYLKEKVKGNPFITKKTEGLGFAPLSYNFVKNLIPIGSLVLATIFVLSIWYYATPSENNYEKSISYKKNSPSIKSDNKLNLQEKSTVLMKNLDKKRDAIVKVYPAKTRTKKPGGQSAVTVYNQAIMNDKMGNYKNAIQLYQQALTYRNPKIQKNATTIWKRINYLIHHKPGL